MMEYQVIGSLNFKFERIEANLGNSNSLPIVFDCIIGFYKLT